jgi:hypothetical protein
MAPFRGCDRNYDLVLKCQAFARLHEGMLLSGHAEYVCYASAATVLHIG